MTGSPLMVVSFSFSASTGLPVMVVKGSLSSSLDDEGVMRRRFCDGVLQSYGLSSFGVALLVFEGVWCSWVLWSGGVGVMLGGSISLLGFLLVKLLVVVDFMFSSLVKLFGLASPGFDLG